MEGTVTISLKDYEELKNAKIKLSHYEGNYSNGVIGKTTSYEIKANFDLSRTNSSYAKETVFSVDTNKIPVNAIISIIRTA